MRGLGNVVQPTPNCTAVLIVDGELSILGNDWGVAVFQIVFACDIVIAVNT